MGFDLDRYYTPLEVARNAMEKALLSHTPSVCADSTCGTGQLLRAANDVFGKLHCVGFDRDRQAIAKLKRHNPEWTLAVGDLLSDRSYKRTFSSKIPSHVDLLVLNPPFSHGKSKSIEITYENRKFRGSVAMAHLLRSFELFKPTQGAVVIAPESLLYSETDFDARSALAENYDFKKITDLESCTFKGTRANASIVQICRSTVEKSTDRQSSQLTKKIDVSICRGGLQVHVMRPNSRGVPYIHSTDIRKILQDPMNAPFLRTADVARGRISGWIVLLPRVGLPDRQLVKMLKLDEPVQLSDCVIALLCPNKAAALIVEQRIQGSWDEFRNLYRGTGARYTTLSRLRAWLAVRNIFDNVHTET